MHHIMHGFYSIYNKIYSASSLARIFQKMIKIVMIDFIKMHDKTTTTIAMESGWTVTEFTPSFVGLIHPFKHLLSFV